MIRNGAFGVVAAAFLPFALSSDAGAQRRNAADPPPVAREFRGAWVATVSNIDWPSMRGLPVWRQREELRTIIDRAGQLGLNAIIFQVRPAADALYASDLEPWSEYLTGEQGKAPEPFWDPLAFAVEEAHARGLELHAWFNPFRARHPSARSPVAPQHLSRTHPELVRRYGTHLWMDPGDPGVQEHSLAVILDVVRRYDVDGVHLDDYFYPYRERDSAGASIDFPDDSTYARYVAGGGTLSRDDWRRSNVDRFIERLYRDVKAVKPEVQVGISPFGIWRPGHPPQIQGFDPYEQIYADSRKWLEAGWLDYFVPQLYWAVAQTAQSYPVLLGWWAEHNPHDRHLWPGNFTSRVESGGTPSWPATELLDQIRLTRAHPGAGGNIHFSIRALMQNRGGLADSLRARVYAEPALPPPTVWIDSVPPARPELRVWQSAAERVRGERTITFAPGGEEPARWILRTRRGGQWTTEVLPGWRRSATVGGAAEAIVLAAVDRLGNIGAGTGWRAR